jgi:hypothetical protein
MLTASHSMVTPAEKTSNRSGVCVRQSFVKVRGVGSGVPDGSRQGSRALLKPGSRAPTPGE